VQIAPDRVPVLLKDDLAAFRLAEDLAQAIAAAGNARIDRGAFAHLTHGWILPAKCSWTYLMQTGNLSLKLKNRTC
jgi:hypothetical protein